MNNGKTIGMAIFVIGLIIIIGYGLYQGFENISFEEIDVIATIGIVAIAAGLIILFIAILIEQQKGKKKMKQDIKKEDLEP
jgi:high-affinity Fe2+/Pb2+ permease